MLVNRDAYAKAIADFPPHPSNFTADPDQHQHQAFEPDHTSRRPKISVMLITYNHEKYIAQALESVLEQQTNYDYEINVIEDCSTDRTQEIVMQYVEKYPLIVKPYFNSQNIGRKVTQRNFYRGFRTLTGDYFAILEGDDYWSSPHKLQKQAEFLENNHEYAICACNTVKIYEESNEKPHRFLYWGKQDDGTIVDVINLRSFFHTTGVLYRNVFRGVPPRQYRSKWSCDIFIMISHAEFGKVHHIDEDMAVYRAHGAGLFSTMPQLDGWMFNINGLRRYNAWLGYRHCKAFSQSIVRYCRHVLREAGNGDADSLNPYQFIKLLGIWACYGLLYVALNLPSLIISLVSWIGFCSFSLLYSVIASSRLALSRKDAVFTRKTQLRELPDLPCAGEWQFIWGLNAKIIGSPEVVAGQPVLQLTAVPTKERDALNRHALCAHWSGFVPESKYRVTLWVKPAVASNVHVQLRDSVVAETGKPANECDVRFNLSSQSVITVCGSRSTGGVEPAAGGWARVWADIVTSDGAIYVYLGLVSRNVGSHVFRGAGEQVLFGGITVDLSPGHLDLPRQTKYPVTQKVPVCSHDPLPFPRKPLLFTRKTQLSELRELPGSGEWHLIWDLNVRAIENQEIVAGQPVLLLTAIPTKDRHALCACLTGFVPENRYRVTLWVKPAGDTYVHVQLRDSVVPDTGRPANECDVWFNLASRSVRTAFGNPLASGVEPELGGWTRIWVDIVTSDGAMYVCLGLVSRNIHSNLFRGAGEQVLFGGIMVELSPRS